MNISASTYSVKSPFAAATCSTPASPSALATSAPATAGPTLPVADDSVLLADASAQPAPAHLDHPFLAFGLGLLALGGALPAHAATVVPVATDAISQTLVKTDTQGAHGGAKVTTHSQQIAKATPSAAAPATSRASSTSQAAPVAAHTASSATQAAPTGQDHELPYVLSDSAMATRQAGLSLPSLANPATAPVYGFETVTPAGPYMRQEAQFKVPFDDLKAHKTTVFSIDQTNDSMPNWFGQIPTKDQNPNTGEGDDDGWTAGIHANLTQTDGKSQWVTSLGYDMVTQRGSWIPNNPNYQGLRTDFGQLAVQHNTRTTLDDQGRVSLDYGVGLGVQGIGPMGGLELQQAVHNAGRGTWFEGRHNAAQGLQTNYSSSSLSVSPIITAGAGLTETLDAEGHLKLHQSIQAIGAVGSGVSMARARVGVEAQPTDWLNVSAGVNVDAVSNNNHALDFIGMNGVRPGWDVRAEYTGWDNVHPYVEMHQGGMRGEPNYAVGVTITFGGGSHGHASEGPRLDPLFK